MKRFSLIAVALLSALFLAGSAQADKKEVKKVSGKSACATCEGVTTDGHAILLVTKDGTRWVITGDSESYKKAHKVRADGKVMIATLAGKPETKKGEDGKEIKVVKVSEVEIEA